MFTNRWFQGLWTQRNPFRDAGSTRIEEAFYGARGDAIIDGLNVEVSTRLTVVRRPGTSIYNSQTFAPINTFYEFRIFNSKIENIHVMVDTASILYDGTGPSTKIAVWNKSAGAGQTYMQSVGNTLYFGDGVDQEKWVQSSLSWEPLTEFVTQSFIVDPSNNLQLAIGNQEATITSVQIVSDLLTIGFDPSTPFTDLPLGTNLSLSGLTVATFLNGQTISVTSLPNSITVQANFTHGDYAPAADTGSATTGAGITGTAEPTWAATVGAITQDGSLQWECRGSSVEGWGIATPTTAPTVTQSPAPSVYPAWQASTGYSPLQLVLDPMDVVEKLTTAGVTGGSVPSFNPISGGTTTDGSCVWTNQGPARVQNTAYSVGKLIFVEWVYYVTLNGKSHETVGQAFFECATAGTTANIPLLSVNWTAGLNTLTNDGGVIWQNVGPLIEWAFWGAGATLSLANPILDSNGNLEQAQTPGISGSTVPVWATSQGANTVDADGLTWLNNGPFAPASTDPWIFAYSYGNSITGHSGTASPLSNPITVSVGDQVVVQGVGSGDPQVDTIFLWRTVQGGSLLLYLDAIPNPGAGQTWIYTNTTPDQGLNEEIEAPIAGSNNPPPVGLIALTYHLGRIWGAVQNAVYYSGGPDTTFGSGNEAFPASNVFVYPGKVVRLWPCTLGLVVFTNSAPYLIAGTGTSTDPFISIPYLNNGPGLLDYNAFDVNGSIPYFMTADSQVVSFDPSSGVSEVGFPIGDQFVTEGWSPSTTYVAWHVFGSADKGVYIANASGWFRLMPTPAPESGLTWSPFAQITGGCSAVCSIETSPGVPLLLIGPKTSGPILKRDLAVFTDNGTPYNAYFTIGSVVLAQPGQTAMVDFITTDSVKIGNPLTLQVQLDEIGGVSDGLFEPLTNWVHDLTEIGENHTVNGQRFYLSQTLEPAICRSIQIQVNYGTDTVQNEILNLSLFGGFAQEK